MTKSNTLRMCLLVLFALQTQSIAESGTEADLVLPESIDVQSAKRLTLSDALVLALQYNLDIQLEVENTKGGQAALAQSLSPFELQLTANVSHSDGILPPATAVDGMLGDVFVKTRQAWNLGLSKKLQWGTTFGVEMSGARFKDESGSAVQSLLHTNTLYFRVSQPLLRGFSWDGDISTASVLQAKFSNQRILQEKSIVIARQIERTENAYWNLAESIRSFRVQRDSLKNARQQLQLTQKQIRAGILPPSDLIASETAVAGRELDIVSAETAIENAMDGLRSVLNLPKSQWKQTQLAIDMPRVDSAIITLEQAMDDALKYRKELRQFSVARQQSALDLRIAENAKRPDVNLNFDYGVFGQGKQYDTALSQLESRDARDWSVSLNLRWAPLGAAARAEVDRLQSAKRAQELRHEQFLNDLRTEVRFALRALQSAQRKIVASKKFRNLAERSLVVERKRFLNGKSRNLEVSRREESLANAQTQELQARIAFLRAKVKLLRVTGRLLESKNVELSLSKL